MEMETGGAQNRNAGRASLRSKPWVATGWLRRALASHPCSTKSQGVGRPGPPSPEDAGSGGQSTGRAPGGRAVSPTCEQTGHLRLHVSDFEPKPARPEDWLRGVR